MLIDGKKIANTIQSQMKSTIEQFSSRPPCLAVILVGNHIASELYIAKKTEACQSIGICSIKLLFPDTITETELLHEINLLNQDLSVDGILVQLPLPSSINPRRVMHEISPEKDVDGFHPYNIGKLLAGETDGFVPCTPLGIQKLLISSNINVAGKHAVIIGRSNIVGKPLAALLMQAIPGGNATVTIAHSQTQNLNHLTQSADIVIAAIGSAHFLTADMIKEGAVVIDVGTNKLTDPSKKLGYRIVGDVDFYQVAPKCSYITPVPGGVGPMTIAMLLQNTLISYQKRMNLPLFSSHAV